VEAKVLELVFPADTNHMRTIFGYTLMAWMEPADKKIEKGAFGERRCKGPE
jgi:hypothetical protein